MVEGRDDTTAEHAPRGARRAAAARRSSRVDPERRAKRGSSAALGRDAPTVERRLPDTISSASSSASRWRSGSSDGSFALIDRDGRVDRRRADIERFANLPIVVGDGRAGARRRRCSTCSPTEPELRDARHGARSASATGAGTCASTTASTSCCPRTSRPPPGPARRARARAAACSSATSRRSICGCPTGCVRLAPAAADRAAGARRRHVSDEQR